VISAALDLVELARILYPLHVESSIVCRSHSTLFIASRKTR
jgi:hypothetical protein